MKHKNTSWLINSRHILSKSVAFSLKTIRYGKFSGLVFDEVWLNKFGPERPNAEVFRLFGATRGAPDKLAKHQAKIR